MDNQDWQYIRDAWSTLPWYGPLVWIVIMGLIGWLLDRWT